MNEQRLQERRAFHVRQIVEGVEFNKQLDVQLVDWGVDRVVLRVPFAVERSSNGKVFHGGVLASLADAAGSAATYSGHVFEGDGRIGLW